MMKKQISAIINRLKALEQRWAFPGLQKAKDTAALVFNAHNGQFVSQGSGVFIAKNVILTAAHVLESTEEIPASSSWVVSAFTKDSCPIDRDSIVYSEPDLAIAKLSAPIGQKSAKIAKRWNSRYDSACMPDLMTPFKQEAERFGGGGNLGPKGATIISTTIEPHIQTGFSYKIEQDDKGQYPETKQIRMDIRRGNSGSALFNQSSGNIIGIAHAAGPATKGFYKDTESGQTYLVLTDDWEVTDRAFFTTTPSIHRIIEKAENEWGMKIG